MIGPQPDGQGNILYPISAYRDDATVYSHTWQDKLICHRTNLIFHWKCVFDLRKSVLSSVKSLLIYSSVYNCTPFSCLLRVARTVCIAVRSGQIYLRWHVMGFWAEADNNSTRHRCVNAWPRTRIVPSVQLWRCSLAKIWLPKIFWSKQLHDIGWNLYKVSNLLSRLSSLSRHLCIRKARENVLSCIDDDLRGKASHLHFSLLLSYVVGLCNKTMNAQWACLKVLWLKTQNTCCTFCLLDALKHAPANEIELHSLQKFLILTYICELIMHSVLFSQQYWEAYWLRNEKICCITFCCCKYACTMAQCTDMYSQASIVLYQRRSKKMKKKNLDLNSHNWSSKSYAVWRLSYIQNALSADCKLRTFRILCLLQIAMLWF